MVFDCSKCDILLIDIGGDNNDISEVIYNTACNNQQLTTNSKPTNLLTDNNYADQLTIVLTINKQHKDTPISIE